MQRLGNEEEVEVEDILELDMREGGLLLLLKITLQFFIFTPLISSYIHFVLLFLYLFLYPRHLIILL